jgi:hypothetical protein
VNDLAAARYHCANCHHRAAAPGGCPKCPDEPLLDLADTEVRLMLSQQDDAEKWRHSGKVIGISAGAAIPLTLGIMSAADAIGLGTPNLIQVLFGSGLAVMFGLFAIWKPKRGAPKLSDADVASLEELAKS